MSGMKRQRFWTVALVLFLTASLSGCETVQRKFTRKAKEPKHVAKAIAFEEGPYQKKFSNDYYYKTHYTYWKAWQGEWIDGLDGNRKRTARNAQETVSHLEEMTHYLQPDKAQQLEGPLASLKRIQDQLDSGQVANRGVLKVELEGLKRQIEAGFQFDKIKDQLLPDSVDLGAGASGSAAPGS